ncbi:hypothetical protein BO221_18335 [Archangium sp. Cb G35]|uniref:threonine/serine ThrE exporter family protein n=1 Tax=Archangium sp. Cb G35 TaxID=1920190 RepID=UPI000937C00A|nr:threonine/serine exporter family protein [Archangium sp. Cb G35]OJT23916.1 hypothetical protein BO221_18335 [Archangium sp. Cb G35]
MTDPHTSMTPPDEERAVAFLLDLARALHLAYLPAPAVEEHLRRAARAWGLRVQVFTLQSLVVTEVVSGAPRRVDMERLPFNPHWNLWRTARLLELSRTLAAGSLQVAEARAELDRIVAARPLYSHALVFLAYAVYGAVVAARVGGAWLEMSVAAVIGFLAGIIHFGTIRSMRVDLQKSFLAAFVGTLVAFGFTTVLPQFDAPRAVFGGATLLVPAMVVTLGTHELVTESVEAGMTRLVYGLLRFLMLGAGMLGAVRLWQVFLPLPDSTAASPLPMGAVLGLVALGGVALVFCMGVRWREIPWVIGAVLLAYGTQELTKVIFGGRGSPILSAFVIGIAGILYGRLPGRMPTTVIMPGLLQLVPGFLGTQAILGLLGASEAGDGAHVFDMLMVVLQIVMGLVFAHILALPRAEPRVRQPV